ncbi:hypothetical protein OGATHE_005042 [Ogataea polymorpha]|uniref:Uncharacterized protein n=1 Tax=Ogataea polymorpha TaxID=460523 RepID=A0A9P8T0B5_9ASCO|nr:hypothetical protein OGATHE_005042 [Ogataea polymorpha]
MVLDQTTSKDQHSCARGLHGQRVDASDILNDIDSQLLRRGLESMEEKHITNTAVGQSRTEDRDLIFMGPIQY